MKEQEVKPLASLSMLGRTKVVFFLFLMIFLVGGVSAADCSDRYGIDCSTWDQINYDPYADTYVDLNNPVVNYGIEEKLQISNTKTAYVRFDLSTVNQPVGQAVLYFFGEPDSYSSEFDLSVYSLNDADDFWLENTVNYNNKPNLEALLGTMSVFYANQKWYQINVTNYIKQEIASGNKLAGFAITSGNSETLNFNSRESIINIPQLIISYEGKTLTQDIIPRMPHLKSFSIQYSRPYPQYDPPVSTDEINFVVNNLDYIIGQYGSSSVRNQILQKNPNFKFTTYVGADFFYTLSESEWNSVCTAQGYDCENAYYHDASIGRTPAGRVSHSGMYVLNHNDPLLQQTIANKVKNVVDSSPEVVGTLFDLALWYWMSNRNDDLALIDIMELPPAGPDRDEVYAEGLKGTYQAITNAIYPKKTFPNIVIGYQDKDLWLEYFDEAISGKLLEEFVRTRWEKAFYDVLIPLHSDDIQDNLVFLQSRGDYLEIKYEDYVDDPIVFQEYTRHRDIEYSLALYYLVSNPSTLFFYMDNPCWGYYGYDARKFWWDPMVVNGNCREKDPLPANIDQHYLSGMNIDIGLPMGKYYEITDSVGDIVYVRDFTKAVVYVKVPPVWVPDFRNPGNIDLPSGEYRRINYDGTLGPQIDTLILNGGEGAILIKPETLSQSNSNDINSDGNINIIDLAIVIFNQGQNPSNSDYSHLDLDEDGDIDWDDVKIILNVI